MGIGKETTNQTTEKENIVEANEKSEIINSTDNYSNVSNKNTAIKDYITNLVNKNETNTEIKQNIENNLATCGEVMQSNKLAIQELTTEATAEGEELILRQKNQLTNELSNSFQNVVNQINKTVEAQVQDSNLVKDVEDAMESGTMEKMIDEAISTANNKLDQTGKQKSNQDANIQAFIAKEHYKEKMLMKRGFDPITLRYSNVSNRAGDLIKRRNNRFEHFIGTKATNIIDSQKSKQSTNTEELVSNVAKMSVINDTELYSKISQAFNQTIETVKNVKNEINQKIEAKATSDNKQTNELEIGKISLGGKKNKITIEQLNDAKSTVISTAVITAVVTSDMDSEVKAIAADMLKVMDSFKTEDTVETDTSKETSTSKEIVQDTSQETEQILEDKGFGAELTGTVDNLVNNAASVANNAVTTVGGVANNAVTQVGGAVNKIADGASAFLKIGPIIIVVVTVVVVAIILVKALKTGSEVTKTATDTVVQLNRDNPELFNQALDIAGTTLNGNKHKHYERRNYERSSAKNNNSENNNSAKNNNSENNSVKNNNLENNSVKNNNLENNNSEKQDM